LDPSEVEQTGNVCNGGEGDAGTPGAGGTGTGGASGSGGASDSGGAGGTVSFQLIFNGTFRFGSYANLVATNPPSYADVPIEDCGGAVSLEDIRACTWTMPASNGGVTFGLWPPGMTFQLVGPLPSQCQASIDDTGTPLFTCSMPVTGNPTSFSLTWSR
jgi:hypothetical protein